MFSTLLIALLSVSISVAAQFMLKAGMARALPGAETPSASAWQSATAVLSDPHILGGFALYGVGALIWLSVLAKMDVSKAYPLVGIGFVMTALIGAFMGEHVGIQRNAGILLICLGVVLVGRS